MQITGTHAVRSIFLLGAIVIGFHCPLTLADADAEREALARIMRELELLDPLLAEAEAAADPDARIHFRYDWLKQDLERVRQGIAEHIDAPRAEPRIEAPLRGDYRR